MTVFIDQLNVSCVPDMPIRQQTAYIHEWRSKSKSSRTIFYEGKAISRQAGGTC